MTASAISTEPAEQKSSSRWLLPVIMLVAFSIRLVVVFFTYRGLPDADKFYEQFGWEEGWVARARARSSTGFGWAPATRGAAATARAPRIDSRPSGRRIVNPPVG